MFPSESCAGMDSYEYKIVLSHIQVRFDDSPFPETRDTYIPKALSSTLSHRWPWRSLSSPLVLALWLSSSCIGWMANVKDEIFLRGLESTLWLEAFFQCPAHSNGRHMRSGEKSTVRHTGSRLWSSVQYSSDAFRRFRYYSCQRFRNIDICLKLLQSHQRPSRPKIQYLLQ